MTNYIKLVCEAHGMQYVADGKVSGGSINETYTVDTNKGRFFMKLNSASNFPSMFGKEAEGLEALRKASLLKIPEVIATGEQGGKQYLLLEWLGKTMPTRKFWEQFAHGLAELHQISNSHYGWSSPNYIGSLVQVNGYTTSWKEFYTTYRIMPLVERLYNKTALSKDDVEAAEIVCDKLEEVFPYEPPSLLHGDLWAGNFMAVQSTNKILFEALPSVFDPAVYFGHREIDLGMSLLFGGLISIFMMCTMINSRWKKIGVKG